MFPVYAIVADLQPQMFLKDIVFQYETTAMESMAILKIALCNAPALNMLDICIGTGQIVIGVDVSKGEWEVMLQPDDKHKDQHPCHYKSGLSSKAMK